MSLIILGQSSHQLSQQIWMHTHLKRVLRREWNPSLITAVARYYPCDEFQVFPRYQLLHVFIMRWPESSFKGANKGEIAAGSDWLPILKQGIRKIYVLMKAEFFSLIRGCREWSCWILWRLKRPQNWHPARALNYRNDYFRLYRCRPSCSEDITALMKS